MKYIKVIKPGSAKSQLVEADKVDFYRQYGWEPEITEVSAKLKPRKNTAKAEPAVEDTSSEQEVGKDELKGD
jgi:hypothetical protein